ncbi:histone deacetylase family protein [Alteromonas pelagimontana]|uniref:Histone deacetylase family protein n=1 Tax=Alteromonas pelagimontana TaxID=1858656 RepID=A0A6M4MDT2_9ALTE|nr:histone deacetylase family protein [Alteromonas pelagimontana]QJR81177.1 histone deacetylase family protein [Alteromonas pelagimontana]
MTVRIFRGKDCVHHEAGEEHPERPDRLYAIDDQLLASGLEMVCEHADATPVKREWLTLAHDPEYLEKVFNTAPKAGTVWLDPDTAMMPATLSAARYAAGAGCDAVDWVMAGQNRQAFCMVRPPGHHAEYAAAMGFCVFNNIAVAARYALEHLNLDRVAIVDFDVHHGNGTEHIVRGDNRIRLFSSFQHPFYPHSGTPASADNIVNVPLEAGTDGEVFREKVQHWFALLAEFQPQVILISAGFDAHAEDPLAQLRLREDDFKWISYELRKLADTYCQGRIVSMLEGGYNLSALGRSVVAHLKGMQGDEQETGGA